MKYYIVEIIYTAPLNEIEGLRSLHHEFLQSGYETGKLLLSGPKTSGEGGIVIAKDESEEDVRNFFSNDPYNFHGVAEFRFTEFKVVSHQDYLNQWLS